MQYKLIEKDKPLHVHGLFASLGSAQRHLAVNVPEYVRKGYFIDKTLTAKSFTIVPANP